MYFNKSSTFFNCEFDFAFKFVQLSSNTKQKKKVRLLAEIIVRKNTYNIQCRSQVWVSSHNLFNSIESIDYKKVIFFSLSNVHRLLCFEAIGMPFNCFRWAKKNRRRNENIDDQNASKWFQGIIRSAIFVICLQPSETKRKNLSTQFNCKIIDCKLE